MESKAILPTWASRIPQHKIRQLYEDDARGMLDEALLNEVGWGLHSRCGSFLSAVEAVNGRAPCPVCGEVIHHNCAPDGVLHCPACGWDCAWTDYFKTIQHKQLSGSGHILEVFQQYVEQFPHAREPQEKMLLVDWLIHEFHWYARFGNTRAACVNLIGGTYGEVVAFLDNLTYGPSSTPGLRQRWEAWHAEMTQISERMSAWASRKK